MNATVIDTRSTSRRVVAIVAVAGAVVILAAAFFGGRASVGESGKPFQGTIVNVSANQDAIGIEPNEGDQINGVLAYAGPPELQSGDTVSGEVFTNSTGGSIVYVYGN